VGVQDVRWDQGGTVRAWDMFFFCWKSKENHQMEEDSCVSRNSVSCKCFVSDRMPFIIRKGRWCNIFLNARAPTEENIDAPNDNFYEGLEKVFDYIP
jgi:hypothetical protein